MPYHGKRRLRLVILLVSLLGVRQGLAARDDAGRLALTFGCDANYPPLSSLQSGRLVGIDVDLLEALSERLGIGCLLQGDTGEASRTRLRSGGVDAITGCIRTENRFRDFDFSIPYLDDVYVVFAARDSGIRDLDDLAGHRLALLPDSPAIELILQGRGLEVPWEELDTYPEIFRRIEEGELDCTIAPLTLGNIVIRQEGLSNPVERGRPLLPVQFRIAVRKGDADLLYRINEALAALQAQGRLAEIVGAKPDFGRFTRTTVPPPSPVLVLLLIALALIALAAVLAAHIFRRIIAARTSSLRNRVTEYQQVLDALPFPLYWKNRTRGLRGCNRIYSESRLNQSVDQSGPLRREELEALDCQKTVVGPDAEARDLGVSGWVRLHCRPFSLSSELCEDLVGFYELRDDVVRERERLAVVSAELAETTSLLNQAIEREPSTGLLTRKAAFLRLAEEMERHKRYATDLSVALVRIGNLGALNRERGYEAGDLLLRDTAEDVSRTIRQVDFAGRFSGSRIIVILPHTTTEQARKVTGKIAALSLARGHADTEIGLYAYTGQDSLEFLNLLEEGPH